MINDFADIQIAIGDASLDDLQEYEALITKEIEKRHSAIRKLKFDSFVTICEQFLDDLSDEDRAKCIELSVSYCENCYELNSHFETIEYILNALIEYFKKEK